MCKSMYTSSATFLETDDLTGYADRDDLFLRSVSTVPEMKHHLRVLVARELAELNAFEGSDIATGSGCEPLAVSYGGSAASRRTD